MKPTCSKLKKLVKEEKNSSLEYKRYGYNGLSKDESRHSRFLKRKLKNC